MLTEQNLLTKVVTKFISKSWEQSYAEKLLNIFCQPKFIKKNCEQKFFTKVLPKLLTKDSNEILLTKYRVYQKKPQDSLTAQQLP